MNILYEKVSLLQIWREEWEVPENRLRKGLLQEVRLDVFFPGFPTLKHINHTARLDMVIKFVIFS
jgi:hypothetical protein